MESISTRLRREHRELHQRLDELRNAVDGADLATIARVWTQFERTLDRHLDDEERLLLPRLERRHPEEVAAIRAEHEQLRHLVAELGIQADLRTLRKDVADELLARLERHAAREDSGIYAYADHELEPPHRRGLLGSMSRRAGGPL